VKEKKKSIDTMFIFAVLGGVMVSVPAIGTKPRFVGSNSAEGEDF
jgi:hypothetical protein